MRRLATLCLGLTLGCAHEMSSDERLDRDTQAVSVQKEISESDLRSLNCQDAAAELAKARNENRPEADRVTSYMQLYESLKKRNQTFDEAMSRNPDLRYKEGSQDFVGAHDLCVQQEADVRVEFNTLIRDLVEVPIVQEIKGGANVSVARLDFSTLRQAIESLAPDDKEQLLQRVNNAEKRVESTTSTTSSGKRRGR